MDNKLTIDGIIKEGIGIGLKNALAIVVNAILWILTIWIPYLNVGTTIGMCVGIVAKASKGETIGMTEIFNPAYRKYMGEFFLTYGLMMMGIGAGLLFFFGPGIVIAIAWSQALLLTVDKQKNPTEAITLSNKLTYGKKGTIFLAQLVFAIAVGIASAIFGMIPYLGVVLSLALMLISIFVSIGMNAYIYKVLCSEVV